MLVVRKKWVFSTIYLYLLGGNPKGALYFFYCQKRILIFKNMKITFHSKYYHSNFVKLIKINLTWSNWLQYQYSNFVQNCKNR